MSTNDLIKGLMGLTMRQPKGFRAWCVTMARIKNKTTSRIGPWQLNVLQERICDVVEFCLENSLPIRIITVKPRQVGSSTGFMGLAKWLLENTPNAVAIIIGAQMVNCQSLWGYLTTFCNTDLFDWGHGRPNCGKEVITFGNGSQIRQETARDKDASVGWDCRFMFLTECALWVKEGVANASEMLNHALNSVADIAGTAIVMESTGRGPSGVFWERGKKAVWLHEFQADPVAHRGKYIKVFAGWHEFPHNRATLSDAQASALESDLTSRERRLRKQFGLDMEQIAWRRDAIEKADGDEEKFQQEHPMTWEEAFTASTPSVFSREGLEVMAAHVDLDHQKWQDGMLHFDSRTKGVVFHSSDRRSAMWRLLEMPMPGDRYIIGADFASGKADNKRSDNFDHHSVRVIRAGKFDPENGWRKPRVVAHTVHPCQWDTDILQEELWHIHILYGRCLIVPERQANDGIIRSLVGRGANVFTPTLEQDVSMGLREARPSAYYGFTTTGGGEESRASKRMLVKTLMTAIREYDKPGSGLVVDERTLAELRVFVKDGTGYYGAIPGEHDDTVMSLAFALATIDQATLYRPDPYRDYAYFGDPQSRRSMGEPATISLGSGL